MRLLLVPGELSHRFRASELQKLKVLFIHLLKGELAQDECPRWPHVRMEFFSHLPRVLGDGQPLLDAVGQSLLSLLAQTKTEPFFDTAQQSGLCCFLISLKVSFPSVNM